MQSRPLPAARGAAGLGLVLATAACASFADLRPAPAARETPELDQAAVARVDGVRVVAQADGWPGPIPIREEVTPIRVIIENESDAPLRVRYSEFSLVSPEGRRYSALPPLRIEGDVVVHGGYAAVEEPAFRHSGFLMAPGYRPVYPGIPVFADRFPYDPYYYRAWGPYWVEVGLPTLPMLTRALPEGVISPGGYVDGFFYFQKVPRELERVSFRADLVNAETGRSYAEARVPFLVE